MTRAIALEGDGRFAARALVVFGAVAFTVGIFCGCYGGWVLWIMMQR